MLHIHRGRHALKSEPIRSLHEPVKIKRRETPGFPTYFIDYIHNIQSGLCPGEVQVYTSGLPGPWFPKSTDNGAGGLPFVDDNRCVRQQECVTLKLWKELDGALWKMVDHLVWRQEPCRIITCDWLNCYPPAVFPKRCQEPRHETWIQVITDYHTLGALERSPHHQGLLFLSALFNCMWHGVSEAVRRSGLAMLVWSALWELWGQRGWPCCCSTSCVAVPVKGISLLLPPLCVVQER